MIEDPSVLPETVGDLVKRRVELQQTKKVLAEETKMINGHISEVDEKLLPLFAEQGISKLSTDDGATVHLRSRLTLKRSEDASASKVAAVLAVCDMGEMQSYSWQSLTAWLRERKEGVEEETQQGYDGDLTDLLPEPLRKVLTANDTTEIGVRGA